MGLGVKLSYYYTQCGYFKLTIMIKVNSGKGKGIVIFDSLAMMEVGISTFHSGRKRQDTDTCKPTASDRIMDYSLF